MKYVLVDQKENDIFTDEFDTAEQAIKKAENDWNHLSNWDKSRRECFYIVEVTDEEAEDFMYDNGKVIWEKK